MRPQDTPQPQPTVHVPRRDGYSLLSSRPSQTLPEPAQPRRSDRDAAADLTRQQIDAIYMNDDRVTMTVQPQQTVHPEPTQPPEPVQHSTAQHPSPQPTAQTDANQSPPTNRRFHERTITPPGEASEAKPNSGTNSGNIKQEELTIKNPYQRTHDDSTLKANSTNWQQYHTAWQQYYQQYFHRYYTQEIEKAQAALETEKKKLGQVAADDTVSKEEALNDIRSRIRSKVRERAQKVRKSRHFVPLMAALGVMLVFTFLQYNRVIFSNIQAYVTPGNIEPSNIIVDPNIRTAVSPDPLLVIPKINVQVPIVWDVTPDHESQMRAMERGVAWFGIPGANSKPGQIGNTVLSGHSSNDFFETGDYKFVFAPLHKLAKDDTIEVHHEGVLYTYVVTKKEVVMPTEVNKLIYETDKPMLTLITCTPLGTAEKRLLVTAEQVSPSPSTAKPAPRGSGTGGSVVMPGNEPTLLERVFGR